MTEQEKQALNADNATHLLKCRHCIGANSCKTYFMKCHILKTMPDGRLKIQVYGERNWKDKKHIVKIKYVPAYKVSENINFYPTSKDKAND